jgi:phthalate 4,5-cis-dihydrodiol dehydrogenase
MNKSESRRVRLGIAGLGVAGGALLPAIQRHPNFDLVAIAEPVAETREAGVSATGAQGFNDLATMLADAQLDAVYLATPTVMHVEHISMVFQSGRHVLCEKPMAVRLEDAQAMVAASEAAKRALIVGHAHGFDFPIAKMREIISSGRLGKVRMIHTWHYTDWMYRPRIPEELDLSRGGGITFRQGSHQFDIIRLLGGGLVESVRAETYNWDPNRSSIGAHTVFLRFQDGTAATAVYNGYGYMSAIELCGDVTEWGFTEKVEQRPAVNRSMKSRTPEVELEAKRKRAQNVSSVTTDAPFQPTFGLTIVSCEKGDIRQSPRGLYVYTDGGREEIVLSTDKSPHHLVLDEFHGAIMGTTKPVHDGRWGLANLEVCVAAIESARSQKEIGLVYQVPSAE